MARWRLLTLGTLIFATFGVAHAAAQSSAEADLRRIIQEMLDAVAPGDGKVWERYLHERVLRVDETGTVHTKKELLAEFTPLPPGLVGRIAIDRFRMETHGDVAVVAYEIQEHLDYHGQILRSRFRVTDTWLKTEQGWRLLAEQVAAVLKDPPSIKLTQQQLCEYSGAYSLTAEIGTTIQCTQDGLQAERTGRPPSQYLAEVKDVFFVAGQPRTRRIFVRDAAGKVVAFVDRREGEDVRWNRKL
ncbi:MAG TPA: nuclear transport factor 2 family protein [Steroidobacteraceae bacterium]|nr:nuclear transport factor 2 family protein [Steroidobacteraceae bacterium]